MSSLPEVTLRSATLVGGLLATGAAVIAEATSADSSVNTGSFLLGGAGLVAAISAFSKDYWSDRQKQRDHEVCVLRLKLRNSRSSASVQALYAWARAAHDAVPTLPAIPEIRADEADNSETEYRDA
ncbi:hypothetical protein OJF2_72680 [Aquisphaera giovannonii]|uniref:Uncharacterized protein n=1 Tax=Aquisphaera giovannonii TaxID=406548 RepID=A0A5B9WDL6_9BACT|nr:hypothetical protein [Aquisphaera giovannonii]QEH38662.1 hypothetical protein OJF2_72680 [Aquisphaera giovannonii]